MLKEISMKKLFQEIAPLLFIPFALFGCSAIGDKTASISLIYGTAALISLMMLIGYCCLIRQKNHWFVLLFSSVLVVNTGYYLLSISPTLTYALHANRLAYLGSVFLPMSILMIILEVTKINYTKRLPSILFIVGIIVFLIAASPGYLDIYYREVTIERIHGVTILRKTYGPWHSSYLFYLLIYYILMIKTALHAVKQKKLESTAQSVVLIIAVTANLGVWLVEQLVNIEFEILSLSYIISELFLLGLHMVIHENEPLKNRVLAEPVSPAPSTTSTDIPDHTFTPAQTQQTSADDEQLLRDRIQLFHKGRTILTPTERLIYEAYTLRKSTKEIMAELNIKENTLKFHNKNIYSKLGVSSRKELMELYQHIQSNKE